jgi:hypothetical protein
MKDQRARILPPYTRRVDDTQHRIVKLLTVAALILFCMTAGFFIAIFGLYGWFIPAIPVVLMAATALWMAPDLDTRLDGTIQRVYFVYLGLLLMWPNYIALNAPGLPWISFQRLAMFALVALSLYALATSSRLRDEYSSVLKANPVLLRLFLAWVALDAVMVAVGQFESTSRWVTHQMTWCYMFVVSAWVMSKPEMPQRLVKLILVGTALTAGVVIPEYIDSKPIWADYIPSFLSIDPELLQSLQFGGSRGTEYRSRSIFVNSLVYAEYVGMLIPFSLLAIAWAKTEWRRVLAVALLVLLFTAGVLTQARTAMVGMVATLPAFAGLWVWRRYRLGQQSRDLLGPSLLFSFPAAALTFFVAVLTIPRLRGMVLGGNQHKPSNNAREAQWDMALPQIAKNPLGHGMGSIDRVVPYTNGAGKFTIDSYPINLLIEYGVGGFLIFVGFFVTAIVLGVRVYINSTTRDEEVAGAAAVSIMAFLIARLVLSTEGGQGLAFGMAGVILGLYWQHSRRTATVAAAPKQAPLYPIPPRAAPSGARLPQPRGVLEPAE